MPSCTLAATTFSCEPATPPHSSHCPRKTQAEKARIQQCERFIHKQLHKIYEAPSHYPGFENGQRLNKDRVEWYQDVPIRVITNVIKYAQNYYGGAFCEGNESYAEAWRVHKKMSSKDSKDATATPLII